MTETILVDLKSCDQIVQPVNFLDEVVRTGMKVILLIRYPLELGAYLRDHWITTESVRGAMSAGEEIMNKYSWEVQKKLAEQKLSSLRERLIKKGVEVEVELYTGSLTAIMRDYAVNQEIHWVVIADGFASMWKIALASLGWFTGARFPFLTIVEPACAEPKHG